MADSKIIAPDRTAQITTPQSTMQDRFALWTQAVTDRLNQNIVGTGNPNGTVDGRQFTFYIDDATNDFYVKTTEQGTLTGWKLL